MSDSNERTPHGGPDAASHDDTTSGQQAGSPGDANTTSGSRRHERTFTEEFKVSGEAVVSKIKELLREGNVRRITIKNEEGRTLIEIPLTIGVLGTVLLPVWAAIGAIAALVANLTIAVERKGESAGEPEPGGDDLRRDDTPHA